MMLPRRWRSWGRGGCALLALAALCALRVRAPPRAAARAAFPRAAPHALAAHLADFNNLRILYPHIESWRITEQWSNYTTWRYSVQYWCGAHCAGRGEVRAHDAYAAAAPAHGRAAAHRVALRLDTCRTLPLLPWPAFCEEEEMEWAVEGDGGGGARVEQTAARRTPLTPAAALGWLTGAGADAPDHLAALRGAFA